MLFLMMDANFCAKLKDCSLDDFEIAPGWSYYVENKVYKTHVDSLPMQSDVSALQVSLALLMLTPLSSGSGAVVQQNTRLSRMPIFDRRVILHPVSVLSSVCGMLSSTGMGLVTFQMVRST